MTLNKHLPWYTVLLGTRPKGESFNQLITEFSLHSQDDADASIKWFENENFGVSVSIRDDIIRVIQIFSPEHPYFKGSQRELPLGLNFEMILDNVHDCLGVPDKVNAENDKNSVMGHSGIDRYFTQN